MNFQSFPLSGVQIKTKCGSSGNYDINIVCFNTAAFYFGKGSWMFFCVIEDEQLECKFYFCFIASNFCSSKKAWQRYEQVLPLGRFLLKMGECDKFLSTKPTVCQILFPSQGYLEAGCCGLEAGVAVSM